MNPENKLSEENRRLRQENEALRLQQSRWQVETEALRTQLEELEIIRRNLEHTIGVYKRCLFGSRSEKLDPKELEARIAQATAEAREQLAKEKRPGDPPPEAEEEQPEEKADLRGPRGCTLGGGLGVGSHSETLPDRSQSQDRGNES